MKIESYLPIFAGYYGFFDGIIERCEENELEHINELRGDKDLEPVDWDDVKWSVYDDARKIINERCVDWVEDKIKELLNIHIKVNYQSMVSPKYYNFSNDSINVEYEIDSLTVIRNYLIDNRGMFEEYLLENYKSRDGFISSHSHKVDDWLSVMYSEKDLEHKFGSILHFIIDNEMQEAVWEMYYYAEEARCNDQLVYAENFDELTETA